MSTKDSFLNDFLNADQESREAMIDEETRQIHLAREFARYDKASKVCSSPHMKALLERCKRDVLKLMERR